MKQWWTAPAGVLLAAALVAGCSSSGSETPKAAGGSGSGSTAASSATAEFPVTVGTGSTAVTIATKPARIVSLSPTATESLFGIGAAAQVVAVDKNSDYPASVPHSSLDAYQLNAEAVAAYRPDLVVESGLTPAQVKQLTALKLTVLDQPAAATLDQAYQQITDLGKATGNAAAAGSLVESMKQKIAGIVADTPKPAAGTTFYYELDPTYYSVTTSTFVGQLFKQLGLASIADTAKGAAAAGGYPQLNSEYVVKSNPAYLFLADTKCCQQSAKTVAARSGWSVLAAVKGGRIEALDDDIASRWGPRVVDLLQAISTELKEHPVK
ncbi:MAG: ABC transporter substrate-binding protein [Actinobacteria bacterium]|nr:ABC transporter substrate-binding protein [Actinomycetota bacterium]